MKDETAIREYLDEINGFTNTGIYMYTDEVPYCQAKYNKALAAAQAFPGGLDELAAYLRAHIPEDKRIILNEEDMQGWTPLWRLCQELQCCHYQDMPQPDWSLPYDHPDHEAAVASWLKCDRYEEFVSELCMLNAVLMAASEHC